MQGLSTFMKPRLFSSTGLESFHSDIQYCSEALNYVTTLHKNVINN